MLTRSFRSFACAVAAASIAALAPRSSSASMTAAQAISSVSFLTGTWHCTGDGPPEDDTYTIRRNVWRDTDSLGGIASGTFDAKRQKWVVLFMTGDAYYGVNEAPPAVNGTLHLTVPYPPSMTSQTYTFKKLTATEYKLGKQICSKK